MNNRRLSGFVLITSCLVLVIFGYIFTPPNLYQERDIGIRMNIVEQYRSQFNIAQIATAVGGVGMAAGYLLLSLYLRRDETARLASIGAVFMFLGAVSLAILMLGGVLDPRAYLERDSVQGSALSIFFKDMPGLRSLGMCFTDLYSCGVIFPGGWHT